MLTEPRPEKILFVCSRETRELVDTHILPAVSESGWQLSPAQYEIISISDPQDLAACVREMETQLTPLVRRWRAHDPQTRTVTVDPTGGTKIMSMSLALVARRWECTFRYVGGTARHPGTAGPGVVQTGAEQVFQSHNPLDVLGYQTAEDALTLAAAGDYAAGQRLLEASARGAREPNIKRALYTLSQLLGLFAAWDRFDHKEALSTLRDKVEKNCADLHRFLAPETCLEVERQLPAWRQRLETLSAERPSLELIEDLLGNAARRREEGRYVDAVARLYRAVEAMAQWRLATQYQIPDTGAVPAERIPESLRAKIALEPDGTATLGLQKAYELLYAVGDPLGQRFKALGLGEPGRSALEERNQSIAGHGWKPMSQKGCETLWQKTLALAAELGFDEAHLFRFPELKPRSA